MSKSMESIKTVKSGVAWEAPEFAYYPKDKSWYIKIAVIALMLAVVFFFIDNYPAIAVIVIGTIVLFIQSKIKPKIIRYSLDESGIKFKNKEYSFKDLKSFWIYNPDSKTAKLYLEQTKRLSTPLNIYLINVNVEMIKKFLLRFLPEKTEIKESFQDNFSKIIRF